MTIILLAYTSSTHLYFILNIQQAQGHMSLL